MANIQNFRADFPIADPETGLITPEFLRFLFDKDNGIIDIDSIAEQALTAAEAAETTANAAQTTADAAQADVNALETTVANLELDDLADVVITSPTTGDVVKYNGTNWVNDTSGGGGSIAVDEGGTEVVASATRLNFTGSGVTVTDSGSGEVEINIPGGGGGGGGVPTIVQTKGLKTSNMSGGITLDSVPTEGNLLIAIVVNAATVQPATTGGWTQVYTDTSIPDYTVMKRVAGPSETALQNPTTTTTGGAIIMYETTGTQTAHSNIDTEATNTSLSANFSSNNEYLPTSSGIGIVYGARHDVQTGSWSGSFTEDENIVGTAGEVGGTGVSLTSASATYPVGAAYSATVTWSTSASSRCGFVLVA